MKKTVFAALCLMSLMAACATQPKAAPQPSARPPVQPSAQPSSPSAQPSSQLLDIVTPSGWLLEISPNGSGHVSYGQAATDSAAFPAGTFDFARVRDALRQKTAPTGSLSADCAVAVRNPGETATKALYFHDPVLAGNLFKKAVGAAQKTGTRIDELYKSNPPIPAGK